MARNGYISNFDDLRTWFLDAKTPKFTIAAGDIASRKYVYKQEDPLMNEEEAWNLLEERLRLFAGNGGTFSVHLPTKSGGNGWTMLFRLPQEQTGAAAMNGVGNAGMYGGNVNSYIAEKISDKLEVYELRRKVQDLENEIDNQGSWLERLFNRLSEHPNFDPTALTEKAIDTIGAIFAQMAPKNASSVSLSGFPSASSTGAAEVREATDEEIQAQGERIGEALQRVATLLPDIDVAALLEGLANYIEKNPQMARMIITQQIMKA